MIKHLLTEKGLRFPKNIVAKKLLNVYLKLYFVKYDRNAVFKYVLVSDGSKTK